jgi:protein phosphatase
MYTYAVKVDKGAYEENNDDRALVGSMLVTDGESGGSISSGTILAAVCDGVGGMAQGYRAATDTLECIKCLDREGVVSEDIRAAIEQANKQIRNTQNAENLQNGLRTTIAGIYASDNNLMVYNAGDSRVYRFRYRFMTQLSKDHSLVRDMLDIGEITEEEAKTHPMKNIINKCVGNDETVNPRIVEFSDDLMPDDIIMICSDGITDEMDESDIKEIIAEHKEDESLVVCCRELINKAMECGSKDNMSIILIRKGE